MKPGPKEKDIITKISEKISLDGECWLWDGSFSRKELGIPIINHNTRNGRQSISVRHFLWESEGRTLKDGTEVKMVCDSPRCVNPKHMRLNDPISRFWGNVVIPDNKDDCWEWQGSLNHHGYGNFRGFSGKNDKAHRFSYRLHFGEFEEKLEIMHLCDNPRCVNPRHLKLGTHLDNMRDMVMKGRSQRGELTNTSKLTEEMVKEIRETSLTGKYTNKDLSTKYGVTLQTIRSIIQRKSWGWL